MYVLGNWQNNVDCPAGLARWPGGAMPVHKPIPVFANRKGCVFNCRSWIRSSIVAATTLAPATASGRQDTVRFATFNAFFVRALETGARPVATDPGAVVSPVDGTVSAAQAILDSRS